MSARLLKKILKEHELQQPESRGPEIEESELNNYESETDYLRSSPKPSKNPFQLLNADDDYDKEDNSGIGEQLSTENADQQVPSNVKSSTVVAATSYNKSKKKKGKKKQSSKGLSSSTDKVEESLDVILETLSLDVETSRNKDGSIEAMVADTNLHDNSAKNCTSFLLKVDPKLLNAENELRRIFGSKVVNSFENSRQTGSSRHLRGARLGSHRFKKTFLVSPSDHWPRWDGSLSMELMETRNGCNYFRYVHSSSYTQAERALETARAIHDLNAIASILISHPYHLESLITMADYFKFVGEHQMSAEAIAKCLYAMECTWHPLFTPFQGNCQLKFCHATNRPIFSTLFLHMKNLDRRGCHRAALEVCKLLLSLDTDDPKGAIFCIDYFSLRAEQYEWLELFSEDSRNDNSIWLFPNFSYSLSVCRFLIERDESGEEKNKKASSVDLMKQALLLHPSVLKKLVVGVPLKDHTWGQIVKSAFFKSDQTGNPSLDHLVDIYIARSCGIWRSPPLQELLRDSALQVLETVKCNGSEAKDWACVRKEAFSSLKNEYDHLLVSDFSDAVPTAPPDNLQEFMVGPVMREMPPGGGQGADRHGRTTRDLHANRSPLAALFESMLPWVDYGGRGDEGADEDNQPNGHDQVHRDH